MGALRVVRIRNPRIVSYTILFVCLIQISAYLRAVTDILVQNNTQQSFTINTAHNGSEEGLMYEQRSHSIGPMQRKKILWIGSAEKAEQLHFFTTTLSNKSTNLTLHQKIAAKLKLFKRSSVAYGISTGSIPVTWHDTTSPHEFLITTDSKPILVTYKKYEPKLGTTIIEYTLQEEINTTSSNDPETLNVLLWNIWMKPYTQVNNGQLKRAQIMPPFLVNYDIIILCELSEPQARDHIIEALKSEYPYLRMLTGPQHYKRTLKNGKNRSGGIVILSKWPIEVGDQKLFNDVCSGSDCDSAKGILYAKINKQGAPYHIFGAYMQAWPSNKAALIRNQQLHLMKKFIDDHHIPTNEPIIIGGDFNINKYKSSLDNRALSEYQEMLSILNATQADHKGHRYSIDPSLNKLVSRIDPKEYTDYLLYVRDHRSPRAVFTDTLMLKSKTCWQECFGQSHWDLSTHFAIYGNFKF